MFSKFTTVFSSLTFLVMLLEVRRGDAYYYHHPPPNPTYYHHHGGGGGFEYHGGFGFGHYHHAPFPVVPFPGHGQGHGGGGWSSPFFQHPAQLPVSPVWSPYPTIQTEKPTSTSTWPSSTSTSTSTATTTTDHAPPFHVPTDLKPSITGWATAYSVPCGNYTIHPFAVARLRYKSGSTRSTPSIPFQHPLTASWSHSSSASASAVIGRNEAQLRSFAIHHPSAPVTYPPPQSCAWKFQANGPCKLKFTCSWFQMPALFKCEENYIDVTDKEFSYRFCGSRKPRGPYISTKETLQLTFNSRPAYSLPTTFDCKVECTPEIFLKEDVIRNKTRTETEKEPEVEQEPPKFRYDDCKCGIPGESSSTTTRIIGGSQALPGEFPWSAALIRGNKPQPFCGAVLINSNYVLTAAHCLRLREGRMDEGPIEVLLNEHDISHLLSRNQRNQAEGNVQRLKIASVIPHPLYNSTTYDHDVALLQLEHPIQFPIHGTQLSSVVANISNSIDAGGRAFFGRERSESGKEERDRSPICLPLGRTLRDFTSMDAIVTGFGLTKEGGIPSKQMMKATVQIFNDASCQDFYRGKNVVISGSMLCAGNVQGKMDSCIGDSGGPLVVNEGGRYTLAGIVSWGSGCGRPNKPGVYTRMSEEIVKWIQLKTSGRSSWCKE